MNKPEMINWHVLNATREVISVTDAPCFRDSPFYELYTAVVCLFLMRGSFKISRDLIRLGQSAILLPVHC